jgi:ADP-heptose:LPS heptosyltransferase
MKILIIKLGALGDIITSTSIINQIMKHHDEDEIYLLTSSAFKDLFSNFKKLDVFAFERNGLLNTIKTILWIRERRFNRVYDLQSNDRSTIYCALSGSPFRAGNHPRYPYHVHPKNKYIGECHSFERLNQIIESANIKPAKPLPFLPIPNNIVTEVSNWLNEHSLSEKSFVLLHAGSSPLHLNKRWPFFSELASTIRKTLNIVWIGGNDDTELNEALSKETGINATNAFNILGLVELGKRAKFAITNDSAPMHILSCSQIPVFGLFGPTYARRTHALGQLDNVITASNIMANNDYGFKPENISNISLDKVLNKLNAQKLL